MMKKHTFFVNIKNSTPILLVKKKHKLIFYPIATAIFLKANKAFNVRLKLTIRNITYAFSHFHNLPVMFYLFNLLRMIFSITIIIALKTPSTSQTIFSGLQFRNKHKTLNLYTLIMLLRHEVSRSYEYFLLFSASKAFFRINPNLFTNYFIFSKKFMYNLETKMFLLDIKDIRKGQKRFNCTVPVPFVAKSHRGFRSILGPNIYSCSNYTRGQIRYYSSLISHIPTHGLCVVSPILKSAIQKRFYPGKIDKIAETLAKAAPEVPRQTPTSAAPANNNSIPSDTPISPETLVLGPGDNVQEISYTSTVPVVSKSPEIDIPKFMANTETKSILDKPGVTEVLKSTSEKFPVQTQEAISDTKNAASTAVTPPKIFESGLLAGYQASKIQFEKSNIEKPVVNTTAIENTNGPITDIPEIPETSAFFDNPIVTSTVLHHDVTSTSTATETSSKKSIVDDLQEATATGNIEKQQEIHGIMGGLVNVLDSHKKNMEKAETSASLQNKVFGPALPVDEKLLIDQQAIREKHNISTAVITNPRKIIDLKPQERAALDKYDVSEQKTFHEIFFPRDFPKDTVIPVNDYIAQINETTHVSQNLNSLGSPTLSDLPEDLTANKNTVVVATEKIINDKSAICFEEKHIHISKLTFENNQATDVTTYLFTTSTKNTDPLTGVPTSIDLSAEKYRATMQKQIYDPEKSYITNDYGDQVPNVNPQKLVPAYDDYENPVMNHEPGRQYMIPAKDPYTQNIDDIKINVPVTEYINQEYNKIKITRFIEEKDKTSEDVQASTNNEKNDIHDDKK